MTERVMEATTKLGLPEAASALEGAGAVLNMVGKIALPITVLGLAGKVLDWWANGSNKTAPQQQPSPM